MSSQNTDKQKILLLHGWGSSHKSWEEFSKLMYERGYEVMVPDMPGFGENPAPERPWHGSDYKAWVLDYIEKNKLETPLILMGHSFGGGLAMGLAIERPELIKKLILVAAARLYVKKSLYKRIVSRIARMGKKVSPFIPFFDATRKVAYRFIIRERDYTRVTGTMKETFVNIIKEDLTPYIHKIKSPTLVVWGDKDKATPVEHARLIADKVEGAELEIIEKCGHAINLERPDKLAEIVNRFLRK